MTQTLHPDTDFEQIMVNTADERQVILVKHQGQVYAYENRCPHLDISLDYGDGSCLAEPGVLICAMHGALFEASTGYCFAGPCEGKSLPAVALRIDDDGVHLA